MLWVLPGWLLILLEIMMKTLSSLTCLALGQKTMVSKMTSLLPVPRSSAHSSRVESLVTFWQPLWGQNLPVWSQWRKCFRANIKTTKQSYWEGKALWDREIWLFFQPRKAPGPGWSGSPADVGWSWATAFAGLLTALQGSNSTPCTENPKRNFVCCVNVLSL